MATFRRKKVRFPMCQPLYHETYLQAKWRQKAMFKHYQNMANGTCYVDDTPPKCTFNVHLKLKKLLVEGQRLAAIERDNRHLLERIILRMKGPAYVDHYHKGWRPNPGFSLGYEARMREVKKINAENRRMLDRILATTTTYDHFKMEMEYRYIRRSRKGRGHVFREWNERADERREEIVRGWVLPEPERTDEERHLAFEELHKRCFPDYFDYTFQHVCIPPSCRSPPGAEPISHDICHSEPPSPLPPIRKGRSPSPDSGLPVRLNRAQALKEEATKDRMARWQNPPAWMYPKRRGRRAGGDVNVSATPSPRASPGTSQHNLADLLYSPKPPKSTPPRSAPSTPPRILGLKRSDSLKNEPWPADLPRETSVSTLQGIPDPLVEESSSETVEQGSEVRVGKGRGKTTKSKAQSGRKSREEVQRKTSGGKQPKKKAAKPKEEEDAVGATPESEQATEPSTDKTDEGEEEGASGQTSEATEQQKEESESVQPSSDPESSVQPTTDEEQSARTQEGEEPPQPPPPPPPAENQDEEQQNFSENASPGPRSPSLSRASDSSRSTHTPDSLPRTPRSRSLSPDSSRRRPPSQSESPYSQSPSPYPDRRSDETGSDGRSASEDDADGDAEERTVQTAESDSSLLPDEIEVRRAKTPSEHGSSHSQ